VYQKKVKTIIHISSGMISFCSVISLISTRIGICCIESNGLEFWKIVHEFVIILRILFKSQTFLGVQFCNLFFLNPVKYLWEVKDLSKIKMPADLLLGQI
jgi:hypothetical protein